MNTVIRVENICKEYRLGVVNHGTMYRDLQSLWAKWRGLPDPNSRLSPDGRADNPRHKGETILALDDVSFDIRQGESVAFLGCNGAGKTTLMKIVSEIVYPSRGRIRVRGEISTLLGLGTGFNGELTARDNVFLNGTIIGMKRREIARRFDEIIDFAEVGQFVDTPIKRYSSGMRSRLAFSTAVHFVADTIILDEALSAGDVFFKTKAESKLTEIVKNEGRTVLVVSHSMKSVQNLCQRAIFLEKGKLVADGPVKQVVKQFLESQSSAASKSKIAQAKTPSPEVVDIALFKKKKKKWRQKNLRLREALQLLSGQPLEGNSMEHELKITDDPLDFARNIIAQEGRAIIKAAALLGKPFHEAVSRITQKERNGNVIVTGIGKAGLIGKKISATMASTGTRSFFLHPAEAVHGDLGRIGSDDIVLVLSQSGETEEVVRLLPAIRKLGATIIALTATNQSTLGQSADIVLSFGKLEEADSLGLAPSTSTAVMLALGDALALTASRAYGFRAEDFAVFHPGGSLGRNLSLVEDHMRPLEQCRFANENRTLREILSMETASNRCSGAIMLTDDTGKLSGILTDSDLRRLIGNRLEEQLDQPACHAMTKQPKHVRSGSSILDAIAILTNLKISELPVVNAENDPVGLIDITDMLTIFPDLLQEREAKQLRVA